MTDDYPHISALTPAEQLARRQRISQVREKLWELQQSENWLPEDVRLDPEQVAREIHAAGGFTVRDQKQVLSDTAFNDWLSRHRGA